MFDAHFDDVRRRLSVCYAGFWTDRDVGIALDRLRAEIAAAAAGGPFGLLEDFCGFPVQTASVIEASQAFVDLIDRSPITRNAMVADSALLRAQLRRQPGYTVAHAIFACRRDAERWLAEIELPPARPGEPVPGGATSAAPIPPPSSDAAPRYHQIGPL